ncbi:MAG: hypothetical protein QOF48_442 [Verrucomicrobiota bacterium]|jgi:hypothetical protein
MQFKKHYTLDEARALLPQIRQWLTALNRAQQKSARHDERSAPQLASGADLGGSSVNEWLQNLAQIQKLLLEFQTREIEVKDLKRGLIDFPAIIGGREVFLCWEQDEEDIEYWHDLETGYAGREKLKD